MEVLKSVLQAMEFPQDTVPGETYLQLYGNRQLKLESNAKMIDYCQDRLLLQCKTCRIEIQGCNLQIRYYSGQELQVEGKITNVRYLPSLRQ